MPPRRPLPTWIPLALTLLGCGGNVVVDGTAGSAPAASVALVTATPEPGGLCYMQPDQIPQGGSFLLLASQPITCDKTQLPDLLAQSCPAGSPFLWEACIALQPGLAPQTITLNVYGPSALLTTVAPGCDIRTEGYFQFGTVAITAVDPSSVTFTLAGTNQGGAGGQVVSDGTYEAPRCP